ncbi:MAG: ABC transporter ATP-binding protein [Bacillota bacterium]|nr:ABC transporter ATP-binding protein [Bacillota bacterium]
MQELKGRTDRILTYFKNEKRILLAVTVSGILYNTGIAAAPWFEGKLAQYLCDILRGSREYTDIVLMAALYVVTISAVQGMRCLKRLYVRKFGNSVNRKMKNIIYRGMLNRTKAELKNQVGDVMTKAISDADACSEGLRKFTTEVFDTGVVMASYIVMLLIYDPLLTLISLIFPVLAYLCAQLMRKSVTETAAAYKESAGRLNSAALERINNALLYRNHGQEKNRDRDYEKHLDDYEKNAVQANIRETAPEHIYYIIAMAGIVAVLWAGSKNVLGTGWESWNIAAFTTYVSCYTKLAVKSSKAARLFNAVQKAQVSWNRIKPFMKQQNASAQEINQQPVPVHVCGITFAYPGEQPLFRNLSFTAEPGQIIGITGPIACGKSTLGKVLAGEYECSGRIIFGDNETDVQQRLHTTGYMGHEPELFSDSIRENIMLGCEGDPGKYLRAVRLDEEVSQMEKGIDTVVGDGGIRLSGGQQARLALARTLFHRKSVMILDDPFSAVDKETEKEIMVSLRRMASDCILIIISHRLSIFPDMDQVIWLDQGKTLVSDHNELMSGCEEYRELYNIQNGKGGCRHEI